MACYDGPIPVTDEERLVIWRWAKANGIDEGLPITKVAEAINTHFFSGEARPEWITDIISGRKTPFKELTKDAWRKQKNRKDIIREAERISKEASQGPVGKILSVLDDIPRVVAVAYHYAVFPFSHAGDILFRPEDWDIWVPYVMNAYHKPFSEKYTLAMEASVENDSLFPMAMQAKLEAGPTSKPSGILSRVIANSKFKWAKEATLQETAERSWRLLSVFRYKLWKSQMERRLKPEMTAEEKADVAKNIAEWANNATGAGHGFIEHIPGRQIFLFGPRLTQSKINRMAIDPVKTVSTFANWKNATPGEKAVAWTRLEGVTQYFLTYVGFLAVNQGILTAFGSKQKINYDNPNAPDYLLFKGLGLEANMPGLHTEIRTLAGMLAATYASKKDLYGKSKRDAEISLGGRWLLNKGSPTVDLGLEGLLGQNWRGQPLPWSGEKGTPKNPKLDWNQYLISRAPIPMEGPIGYFYNKLKQNGMSSMDAMTITKGLIITGLGFTGIHIQEEPEPTSAKSNR